MIKELVRDEAILSTPCRPATAEDAPIAQDLLDTMEALEDAGCLSANQIGETVAIAVYLDDSEQPHVVYNPKMQRAVRPYKTVEDCLTREEPAKVTRYERCMLFYDELVDGKLVPRKKQLEGFTAELAQHAIDHCKGKYV